MNNFSGKVSAIIKGSVCLLGLVSVGNFFAAPANAGGQATARGAVTVVRPSGLSESVSGEVLLPTGMYFDAKAGANNNAALVVTPGYATASATTGGGQGSDTESVSSLTLNAGTPTMAQGTGANPFLNAAGAALGKATAIEDQAAIIKAGAGVNGLGGLE